MTKAPELPCAACPPSRAAVGCHTYVPIPALQNHQHHEPLTTHALSPPQLVDLRCSCPTFPLQIPLHQTALPPVPEVPRPPRCSEITTTTIPSHCKEAHPLHRTPCLRFWPAHCPNVIVFLNSSPQGRIFQVEYAAEAVKQGSVVVGLTSKTHAVLVAIKVCGPLRLPPCP